MQTVSMSVIALHATHRLSRTLGYVRLLWSWPEALSTPRDACSSQPYLSATKPLSSISMPMDSGLYVATSHPYTEGAFSSQNFLGLATVALSFVFSNWYLIID